MAFHVSTDTVSREEKHWGECDALWKRTCTQVPCWARQCPFAALLGSSNPGSWSILWTLSVLFISHVAFGLCDHCFFFSFCSLFPLSSWCYNFPLKVHWYWGFVLPIWIHWCWSQNPVLGNWVPKLGVQFSLEPAPSTRLGHKIEWKIPYWWGGPAQPWAAHSACSCFPGSIVTELISFSHIIWNCHLPSVDL